ncbi:hypothetical protein GGR57DRAFT_201325 [Xylariaceae sp. FL1272]|nr:hypothetical protein GGR57DRAFT_201325 [Xylariaceae sp. FL1272]
MAAISAASGTTFTHSNGSQDNYGSWNHTSADYDEDTINHQFVDYDSTGSQHLQSLSNGSNNRDPYSTPRESRSNSRAGPKPRTKKAQDGSILTYDDENSKWIHRDKLAKIESEELQAAGIILPKSRSQSRPRRDRSQDKSLQRRGTNDSSDQQPLPRARNNSELSHDRTPDIEVPSWDLRLPEEIAEDPGEYWIAPESAGTRIPVAKLSPAPIASDFLDRNAPVLRKPSFPLLDEEASIAYPKTRSRRSSGSAYVLDDSPKAQPGKRSVTEGSPKKVTAGRKTSAPVKSTTPGRPKTRSGSAARSGSTTRPSTRSGEMSPRAPEGDPPWMISAYQPDPRLPPDQQLLPTVAKRLQQERWEQEGQFGNVYDKEFRPLNNEVFAKPPELEKPQESTEERHEEWPLRHETRGPTPSRPGTSSYSTMPKIQDKPGMSPMASPRIQQTPRAASPAANVPNPPPEEPEKEKEDKRSGCGCCLVM